MLLLILLAAFISTTLLSLLLYWKLIPRETLTISLRPINLGKLRDSLGDGDPKDIRRLYEELRRSRVEVEEILDEWGRG